MFRIIFCFGIFVAGCSALKCRRCENSPDVCNDDTRVEDCSQYGADQVCANFYYWSNGKAHSEKKCYQRTACLRQQAQKNYCETHDGKDKPCRCCCSTNECNSQEKGCIVPSVCRKPKNPRVGEYTCPNKKVFRLNDKCNFTCPDGFDLMGPNVIVCERKSNGKLGWSGLSQRCKKIRCPKIEAPGNGTMQCKNTPKYQDVEAKNRLGSSCNFKCDPGYKLIGEKQTRCKSTGKWSSKVPKCVPDPCTLFPKVPNREDKCTNGNMLGSKCTFKCKKGYKLIGSVETTCGVDPKDSRGREWDKEPPKCIKIRCEPEQKPPPSGTVSCTNDNFEDSVCTFKCNKGFDIVDNEENSYSIKCEDDGDSDELGEWSGPPAKCRRIVCQPIFTDPVNGTVDCTNKNFLDSVCSFKCNKGYDLDDTRKLVLKSECQDDGDGDHLGQWSLLPAPTCSPIKCEPPHTDPENGEVSCTHKNWLDSVCTFRCNMFYDLDGTKAATKESVCSEDASSKGTALGKWIPDAATCSPIECRALVRPDNGLFVCSAEYAIRSACTFRCNTGYQLVGKEVLVCEDQKRDGDKKGEWSSKEPECSKIFCPAQKHDATVKQVCDPPGLARFPVATICTYTCAEDGHYMVSHENPTKVVVSESFDVECLSTRSWNLKAPTCKPVKCSALNKPEFGHRPKCNDFYWYQSTCTFKCLETYALTHEEPLVCESDGDDTDKMGKWSREEPVCQKNQCENYKRVKFGKIVYTDELNIGSVAQLICDSGYTHKIYKDATCLAAGGQREVPDWSRVKNVCCVKCLFNNNLRIVMVVDKTAPDWKEVETWHFILLDFLFTNNYNIRYGPVLYDTAIDVPNSKSLTKISFYYELEDIADAIAEMPHGGSASNSGAALEYAKSTYYKRSSRAEEPFIILMKSSKSSDSMDEAAKAIRDAGINLITMSRKDRNWKDEQREMAKITGDTQSAFIIDDIGDIRMVGDRITELSRARGCSSTSKNQVCP